MQLIGLTGLAASGKSTVAQYLVEQHGFTRLSFAMPLKVMLQRLNPIISDDGEHRLNYLLMELGEGCVKQDYPEYRRLLQVLGTDCIRAIDKNFWVRAAAALLTDGHGKYVFDDCRFPNEAKMITDYNKWGLWRVVRGSEAAADGAHSSEQWAGKMGETQTILNHTSLDHLYAQVEQNLEFTFAGVTV